ncbi:hypothetical protein GCM10028791_10290 [Echinicola sediminis]
MKTKFLSLICLLLLLFSCYSRYQKEDGVWAWVTKHPDTGKRITSLEGLDPDSFTLLENSKYARDKHSVYYKGKPIFMADPVSFAVLNDSGYSKDNKNVYFETEKIILANPASFQFLAFPYSKDESHVFCGTLPLLLNEQEVAEFRVTNTAGQMTGAKSNMKLSYFIELHPEYFWLDTLGIENVTFGEWGTGETDQKKFKGFKEIKE